MSPVDTCIPFMEQTAVMLTGIVAYVEYMPMTDVIPLIVPQNECTPSILTHPLLTLTYFIETPLFEILNTHIASPVLEIRSGMVRQVLE